MNKIYELKQVEISQIVGGCNPKVFNYGCQIVIAVGMLSYFGFIGFIMNFYKRYSFEKIDWDVDKMKKGLYNWFGADGAAENSDVNNKPVDESINDEF